MDYQQRMIRIEYMQYIKMALSLGNTFLHLFHIRNMHIWILHSTAVDSATKNVYDKNVIYQYERDIIKYIYNISGKKYFSSLELAILLL